ncbi:MAG: 4'-phosphopantetheinyl transferase superfamily protein [Proteobacteria bacterium]|nr:4'-phosphopantetheinyl transferase superfamily protein [Pseudomonadota bacterium]
MLEHGTVEVWATCYRQVAAEGLLADYRRLLSEEERVREQRFAHTDDRRRYRVTRALVRTLLSQRLCPAIAPQQWSFAPDSHGRPLISNALRGAYPLLQQATFNVSHTEGLILVGLCRSGDLGVDVEQVRPRASLPRIARRYFAPPETAALTALPPAAQLQAFYEYWTLKESYLKALGVGLALPLDQFAFQLEPGRLQFTASHARAQERGWHFWQMRLAPQGLAAVCARLQDGSTPQLRLRAIVPLAGEGVLDHQVLRTSESTI